MFRPIGVIFFFVFLLRDGNYTQTSSVYDYRQMFIYTYAGEPRAIAPFRPFRESFELLIYFESCTRTCSYVLWIFFFFTG